MTKIPFLPRCTTVIVDPDAEDRRARSYYPIYNLYRPSSLLIKELPAFSLPPLSILARDYTLQELANTTGEEALEEGSRVVRTLYEALRSRDVVTVQKILAPDLEWWFHGPPTHQFLMRLLTGAAAEKFDFIPDSITSFGSIVLSEGCDPGRSISWVHAWTVSDGIITQVREYFNTSLTVTRIGESSKSSHSSSPSDFPAASSTAEIKPVASLRNCPSVWESSLSNRVGKSVPGLVLAI